MNTLIHKIILVLVVVSGFVFSVTVSAYAGIETISKETLQEKLADRNLVILDVRSGKDWSASEFKIKGAHRVDPNNFSDWENRFPKDKVFVLYCA